MNSCSDARKAVICQLCSVSLATLLKHSVWHQEVRPLLLVPANLCWCRDVASRRDGSHPESPLRMSDREASGSGQWQRSGELQSDDEWDASKQHHPPSSHQHDMQ